MSTTTKMRTIRNHCCVTCFKMEICGHPPEETEEVRLFIDCMSSKAHKSLHKTGDCDCDAFTELILLLNHVFQCIGKPEAKTHFKKLLVDGSLKTESATECLCNFTKIFGAKKEVELLTKYFETYNGRYNYYNWALDRKNGKGIVKDPKKITNVVFQDFEPVKSFFQYFVTPDDQSQPEVAVQTVTQINEKSIEDLYEIVEGAELKAQAKAAEEKRMMLIAEQTSKMKQLNDEYGKLLSREAEIRSKIANCKSKKKKQNVLSKLTKSKAQLKELLKSKEKLEEKITRCVQGIHKVDKNFDIKSNCEEMAEVVNFIYPSDVVEKIPESPDEESEADEETEDEVHVAEEKIDKVVQTLKKVQIQPKMQEKNPEQKSETASNASVERKEFIDLGSPEPAKLNRTKPNANQFYGRPYPPSGKSEAELQNYISPVEVNWRGPEPPKFDRPPPTMPYNQHMRPIPNMYNGFNYPMYPPNPYSGYSAPSTSGYQIPYVPQSTASMSYDFSRDPYFKPLSEVKTEQELYDFIRRWAPDMTLSDNGFWVPRDSVEANQRKQEQPKFEQSEESKRAFDKIKFDLDWNDQ